MLRVLTSEEARSNMAHRLARLLQLIEQNDPLVADNGVADTPEQRRRRDALIFEALAVAIACGYDADVDSCYNLYTYARIVINGDLLVWLLEHSEPYDAKYVAYGDERRNTYRVAHRFISAVSRGDVK